MVREYPMLLKQSTTCSKEEPRIFDSHVMHSLSPMGVLTTDTFPMPSIQLTCHLMEKSETFCTISRVSILGRDTRVTFAVSPSMDTISALVASALKYSIPSFPSL